MYNNNRGIWPIAVALFLTSSIYVQTAEPVLAANTGRSLITVQKRQVTPRLNTYAQVVPITIVKVRALTPGNLSQLSVVPGAVVSANQVIARLSGPLIQSRLTTRQQNLLKAQAQARSTKQALHIARRKYKAQLTTQQRLDTAISNQAAARAAVQIARAQLHEIQDMQTLRAPVDGTVLSVQATNGEQMTPKQVIITLQPAKRLWLRAEYYGADTTMLKVGMHGQFKPADHSKPIPVTITTIAPNRQADSGRVIHLVPDPSTNASSWISGTWGKVELNGPVESTLSVPSSALILDQGHWWVLVHTPSGNKPRQVIPGAAHGWSTTIRSGLKPGEKVVVKNAYLLYHRGIANRYMPPD